MADLVSANYPVLADPSRQVSISFEVFDLLNDNVAAPATFMIMPDKTIVWRHIAEDIADRPSSEQILVNVDRLLAQ